MASSASLTPKRRVASANGPSIAPRTGTPSPDLGGQAPGRFERDARPGIAGDGIGEGADIGGVRDEPADDRRDLAGRELDLAAVGLRFGGRVDGREQDGRAVAVLEGHDRLELGARHADHVLDRFAGDLEPGVGAEGHGQTAGEILDELGRNVCPCFDGMISETPVNGVNPTWPVWPISRFWRRNGNARATPSYGLPGRLDLPRQHFRGLIRIYI